MRDKGNPLGTLDEIEACLSYRVKRLEPRDVLDFRTWKKEELIHLWKESTSALENGRTIPQFCRTVFSGILKGCLEDPGAVISLLAQRGRGRPKKSTQRVDLARRTKENFAYAVIDAASGTGPSIEERAEKLMPDPKLRAIWVQELREQAGVEPIDGPRGASRGQGSDREKVLAKQAEVLGVSTRTLERMVRLWRQKNPK